jgi:hypothetical protein
VDDIKKKPGVAIGVAAAAATGLAAAGMAAGEFVHEQQEKKKEEKREKRQEARKVLRQRAAKVASVMSTSFADATTLSMSSSTTIGSSTTTSTTSLLHGSFASIPSWAWFVICMLPVVFCCCFVAGLLAFLSKRKGSPKARSISREPSTDSSVEQVLSDRKEVAPLLMPSDSSAEPEISLPQLPPLLPQAGFGYPNAQVSRPSAGYASNGFASGYPVTAPSLVPMPTPGSFGSFPGQSMSRPLAAPSSAAYAQPAPQGYSYAPGGVI